MHTGPWSEVLKIKGSLGYMGIEDRIILKMYLWKIGCDVEDSTELHKDGIWWRRVHDHSNKTLAHERREVS